MGEEKLIFLIRIILYGIRQVVQSKQLQEKNGHKLVRWIH